MGVLRKDPLPEAPRIKALTPLQVGEIWYARLPGQTDLSNVAVEEITERTVVLSEEQGDCMRYARVDVEFVERVPKTPGEKGP